MNKRLLTIMCVALWTTSFLINAGDDHTMADNAHGHQMAMVKTDAHTQALARELTPAALRVSKTVQLNVAPEKAFALVSDHEGLPKLVPNIHEVSVDNSKASMKNGKGCVRTCSFADGGKLVEDIVAWNPGKSYAYAIRSGNPMSLEHHLGVFHVKSDGMGGSLVTWSTYFNHPMPEQVTPNIGMLMSMVLEKLVVQNGGKMMASAN